MSPIYNLNDCTIYVLLVILKKNLKIPNVLLEEE